MDDYAARLLEAATSATFEWIERSIQQTLARQGIEMSDELEARTEEAATRAKEFVMGHLDTLLSTDVDEQSSTPLAIMRNAVVFPTEMLRSAGVQPVERDDYARRIFPDDLYDLVPANWGDIDASLVEPGLAWSASKVMAHKERHA